MNWDIFANIYSSEYYGVTKTFTSVGYGEKPRDSTIKIIYTMFLQLFGLSVFSYYRGAIHSITVKKNADMLVNEK